MAALVYILPDFTGSELTGTRNKRSFVAWLDRAELLSSGIELLALGADGFKPNPGYPRISEGTSVFPNYVPLRQKLDATLPKDFIAAMYPYDWRLSVRRSGARLRDDILSTSTAQNPARLIGHGFGGLVARYAWGLLKDAGSEHLIAKIVTLGTPHYGSYEIAGMWDLASPDGNDLAQLAETITPASSLPEWVLSPTLKQLRLSCCQTANTWPSVYESGPWLGPLQQVNDPLASDFWDIPKHPGDLHIEIGWISEAGQNTVPFFLAPNHTVPPAVLKVVAGVGVRTIQRLGNSSAFPGDSAYTFSKDGDGVVAAWSATAASSNDFVLKSAHAQLVSAPIVLQNIVPWLFETTPPTPVPLPDLISGVQGQTPVPSSEPSLVDMQARVQQGQGGRCLTGPCQC